MSRSFGLIQSSIWNDKQFRQLPGEAQRAYLMLVTQADISSIGLLALTVRRWAGYASDSTTDSLSDALSVLQDGGYLCTDQDTEEVLVRSFVRWDGGYNNPKRRPAILAALAAITSSELSQVAAYELDKLQGVDSHADSLSDSNPDTPRVVVTEVGNTPQPTTHNKQPASQAPQATPRRGSRLPADWQPTLDLISWVKAECPSVDGRIETDNFRDYWHSKSGADAAKVDWPATYRKWMRTAQQRAPAQSLAARPSTTDQRMAQAVAAGERLKQRLNGAPTHLELT